jgi:hypothetical protein
MNCTDLDDSVNGIENFLLNNDVGFIIAITLLLATSFTLLSNGEHSVKPFSALIGGVGGCVVVYVLSDVLSLPCVARIIISILSGVLLALLALCLFKTGLVLLGAAGFGTIAHFLYDSLSLDSVDPPFLLAGLSGYYYLTMLIAIIVGVVVAYFQKKNLIRISSSLVGGGGLTASIHLIVDRSGNETPPLLLLVILIVVSSLGVALQRRLAQRRKRASVRARNEERMQNTVRP